MTPRTILTISANENLTLHQLDVKTAFLYGELDEEIYLKQPDGFIKPGQEHKVWRLKKALYGLKQAPKCWNKHLNGFLTKAGYSRSSADPCLYYRIIGDKRLF